METLWDILAVVGILATFVLVLQEMRRGVRATARTSWGHPLLLASVVASILGLRSGPTSARWGLLVLSSSLYIIFLYWLMVMTRLPKVRGLIPGQTLGGGNWRKASTGALVPVSSVWGGKTVLLILYRGPWCPYCRSELLSFRDLWAERHLTVPIVAVGHEHPEPQLPTLQRELGATIELFQDSGGTWLKSVDAYQAGGHPSGRGGLAIPHLAWVDGTGRVLWSWRSENYRRRLNPEKAIKAGREFHVI